MLFSWLIGNVMIVVGIVSTVLLIGLIILYPLGALIALLMVWGAILYIRWAKRHAAKVRARNRQRRT